MNRVSLRYASALASVAESHRAVDSIRAGLAGFASLYSSSQPLANFFASPAVPRQAKRAVVEKLAAALALPHEVRNFLLVLLDHRRMALVTEIQLAFAAEINRRLGIQPVSVTSARELDPAEKLALGLALERLTGKKIDARYQREEKLLGGAIVQIGSMIYDGSVLEQLHRLQARLELDL